MSEEQEQLDYEALNAKTALDLNKAQQEIERLSADNKKLLARPLFREISELRERIAKLEAVTDALPEALKFEYPLDHKPFAIAYEALEAK